MNASTQEEHKIAEKESVPFLRQDIAIDTLTILKEIAPYADRYVVPTMLKTRNRRKLKSPYLRLLQKSPVVICENSFTASSVNQ